MDEGDDGPSDHVDVLGFLMDDESVEYPQEDFQEAHPRMS